MTYSKTKQFALADQTLPKPQGAITNATHLKLTHNEQALISWGKKFYIEKNESMSDDKIKTTYNNIREIANHNTALSQCSKFNIDTRNTARQYTSPTIENIKSKLIKDTSRKLKKKLIAHSHDIDIVESDKGKVTGLIYKDKLKAKTKKFINKGKREGRYTELTITDKTIKHNAAEQIRTAITMMKNNPLYAKRNKDRHTYDEHRHKNHRTIYLMNKFENGIPKMRPTVKMHKTGHPIRPIISKKHTPAIAVGKIIKQAIDHMITPWSENVKTSRDVTQDILDTKTHPGYTTHHIFITIDAVSMFDNISLEQVKTVRSSDL